MKITKNCPEISMKSYEIDYSLDFEILTFSPPTYIEIQNSLLVFWNIAIFVNTDGTIHSSDP
jgi:hypothetical protein